MPGIPQDHVYDADGRCMYCPHVDPSKATRPQACPFCGDERQPNTDMVLKDHEGELFAATCQCCGSQGPSTRTRGAALVLWDHRSRRGANAAFHELFNRVSP